MTTVTVREHLRRKPKGGVTSVERHKREINKNPEFKSTKNRSKPKLGNCPYCRKDVYKITRRTIFGSIMPTWVHTKKGNFYHRECWELREKSRPTRVSITYRSPPTHLGQIEIERQDSPD